MKIHFKIFLVLAFSVYISFLINDVRAEDTEYDLKSYYPIKQGNVMIYKEKVEGAAKAQKCFSATFGIELLGFTPVNRVWEWESSDTEGFGYELLAWHLTEGLKLYKEYEGDEYLEYDEPMILFPPKMKIEDSIGPASYNYKWYDSDGEELFSGTESVTLTLLGLEDITVDAGVFTDCLKFQEEGSWEESTGDWGNYKDTFWLAKNVGMVKCIEEETEFESGEEETETVIFELKKSFLIPITLGKD
ncbi:MAG: hypothetical protein SV062_07095 [Thermodesulfobacteriota bacterium]|nr:hypothetical protein [Thermodesulfobacteriota bacterium]